MASRQLSPSLVPRPTSYSIVISLRDILFAKNYRFPSAGSTLMSVVTDCSWSPGTETRRSCSLACSRSSASAGERLGHTAVRYRPIHSALDCQHAPEFHPRICKGTQALRSRSGVHTEYRDSAAAAQGMSRCSLDRYTCRFPPRLCCPQRQNFYASAHSDGSYSWLYRSPPRR
jgi:hypothetical protein